MSAGSSEPGLDQVDFEAVERHVVATTDALIDVFADARHAQVRARLCGSASRHDRLPVPDPDGPPVRLVSLARLDRITRLDAEDLTCSAEPGVRLADLQRELLEYGVRLPVEDESGTIGGLFAAGDDLPPAPSGPSTRHLLLGLSGVLAEGRRFKTGGRVVKNVAGFDLHKLFVGSRGRLFAAVELHLKLRTVPKRTAWFRLEGLESDDALTRFRAVRRDAFPPAMVRLESGEPTGAVTIVGRYEGAPGVVDERLQRHGLVENSPPEPASDTLDGGLEEIVGVVRPSRIARLLEFLPNNVARWTIGGTGRLTIVAPRHVVDELIGHLPEAAEVAAELQRSASPTRRGLATPRDPGSERLMCDLTTALDPDSILT